MTKKINLTFFSNSRSEFGLINQIIQQIKKNKKKFAYNIFLSGTHSSKKYGNSLFEAQQSKINYKNIFNYNTKTSSQNNILNNLATYTLKLPKVFQGIDYVVLFGDRVDLIPIIINCLIYNKKIIHFGGGEETKGSIDDKVRRIISSVSDWHFVSSTQYKTKLLKMGIPNNKIFNVGTLSVNREMISDTDENFLSGFKDKNLVCLTYHPVNINTKVSEVKQIRVILESLDKFKEEIFTIINAPGFEKNSNKIINFINKWVEKKKNFKFYKSLGISKYSKLIQNSKFLIGNSSSGVIMAPFFDIPSINIGDRQDGRVMHRSVIRCKLNKRAIISSIEKILYKKYKVKKNKFLLGNGNAAEKSVKILNKIL